MLDLGSGDLSAIPVGLRQASLDSGVRARPRSDVRPTPLTDVERTWADAAR